MNIMKGKATLWTMILLVISCLGIGYKIKIPEKRLTDSWEIEEKNGGIIKIGVFEPLTGGAASGGEMTLEGIQLANELFPEVLGKKIELVIEDNKSDKLEATKAVIKLIHEDHVKAIIGSYGSSLSMAAGEVVKKFKIPTVGCSPTHPMVTFNNPYYFRVCFVDPFQGTVIANYAVKELGAKKAIIVQDMAQDYSTGLSQYFIEAFIKLTGDVESIVSVISYVSGEQDFREKLTEIRDLKADVIFAPGNYIESAVFIKQAREMGINIPIIGGDTWETPTFIEIGGEAVEGAIFSTHFTAEVPITERSNLFLEAYRKKYNREANAFSALGFDAYMVLIDAIARANSANPEKIRDALANTKNFEGATGKITLDHNGNATKSAIIKKVEKGQFKYVTFVESIHP
ncbi:ABC transporter substrate-binding protein [Thermotalea metallivorans]|uniref:Leucine-binding protein domain-containing protein n=1 Tax=Thermotalea metallivorans TaxID=520762 RepID=A0A140LD27_9FIRM|nr:ABC transporter substrate-binding protein [Thermotalea metallivorans]KXG78452.1 hypothetical protein AN619_02000 [Thermotalea metallivorans]